MASTHSAEELQHLPAFITAPGQTDVLFTVTVVSIIALVLTIGVIYFKLHAIPEQMAHKYNSTQLQVVGILSLLSLVTHNNMFWVAALLLVAVKIPDFITPLNTIAHSLDQMSNQKEELPVSVKLPDFTTSLNSIAQSLEQMTEQANEQPLEQAVNQTVEQKDE